MAFRELGRSWCAAVASLVLAAVQLLPRLPGRRPARVDAEPAPNRPMVGGNHASAHPV